MTFLATLAPALLLQSGWLQIVPPPVVDSVEPLRVHHQGGTFVTVSGAGFDFNGTDAASLRCCWDLHLEPARLFSPTAFPACSETSLSGGDGVVDEATAVVSITDSTVICQTYQRVPGHTHAADLIVSFAPTCEAGALLDTKAEVQYYVDTVAMQLTSASPRGGPVSGGTNLTIRGVGFGGGSLSCRFGLGCGWRDCPATATRALRQPTLELSLRHVGAGVC